MELLSGFDPVIIVLAVLFVWLTSLTVLLISVLGHYRRLTKNINKKDLKTVLDSILSRLEISTKQQADLSRELSKLEQTSHCHIQKIGLVRFNPFPQTGGDQSFSLAFLDARNNGFVLSSLHSRESTRFYAKTVKAGVGIGRELSKEERQAVDHAE